MAQSTKLKFDQIDFEKAVKAVKTAGQTIEASPFNKGDIEADDCKEITIQGYVQRLLEISDLLKDYRELVSSDMSDFEKLGEVIEQSESITKAGFAFSTYGGGRGGGGSGGGR